MKKLIIYSLLVLVFTACIDSDDGEVPEIFQITP